MSDRNLGYLILTFLILFFLLTGALLTWSSIAPMEKHTIVFSDIGNNLSIEDPVRIRGVLVGAVSKISWQNKKAYVEIESPRHLRIHEGYYIEIAIKGMMGDRFISIYPGDTSLPLINQKIPLQGTFLMGPSEALACLYKLKETVEWLRDLTIELRDGKGAKKSLIVKFENVAQHLDSLTISMLRLSRQIDHQVSGNADSISALLQKTATFAQTISRSLPEFVTSLGSMMEKVNVMIVKVDDLAKQSEAIVKPIGNPDNVLWGTYVHDLQTQLNQLHVMILDIKDDGLKLPVSPRFGEKAK